MIDFITKAYVLKNAAMDAADFIRDQISDIDLDKDYWLHKAGLTSYRPTRTTMNVLSMFALGAAVGAITALAFASKPGNQFRAGLKDQAMRYMNKTENATRTETARFDQPRV
jgi:hypothetical protein